MSHKLLEQVLEARERGVKLAIVGRDSKRFLGREIVGEPISVAEHKGIVSFQPEELVLTVRAGTPVADIQAVLAERNMSLSFEPPTFDDQASIGGTLACHLSGPARPWRGSVRDMVLGVRLINGRGQHLAFGGQVIKNVAGYDISRLQAGAMGTLGVITEISFKILPKPQIEMTLMEDMSASAALNKMNRLAGRPLPLTGACWWNNTLYVRLAGSGNVVDKAAASCEGMTRVNDDGFWHKLREHRLEFFSAPARLQRFSVRCSAEHALENADWLLDWGGSQRWLAGDVAESQDELESLARRMGGQVTLYRGGDRSKEVFHSQSSYMQDLMCRVKAALDPDALFNPGRIYSWM